MRAVLTVVAELSQRLLVLVMGFYWCRPSRSVAEYSKAEYRRFSEAVYPPHPFCGVQSHEYKLWTMLRCCT